MPHSSIPKNKQFNEDHAVDNMEPATKISASVLVVTSQAVE
jgi:hypothetical protein